MNSFNLDLSKFKHFYEDNQKMVRMVALILIVGLSILFFWVRGNSRTVEMNISGSEEQEFSDENALIDDTTMYENEADDIYEVSSQTPSKSTSSLPSTAYVDISGEVRNPGVYKVNTETRLFEVIDMAGGLTDQADANSLNRAEKVYDGQKVIVRAYGENSETSYNSDAADNTSYLYLSGTDADGKVNINTADLDELQTITGIGPSKAQSIIDYREQNGYYTSIEEIMLVSGIGEKTFNSIKDSIVV